MPEQVLHPARRREPARLVRVGEQRGDGAPELLRLLGREVRRELAQQPNELTHARRARGAVLGGEPAFQLCAGGADRKSTRLNSSHTVISYAVFCLKKKNGVAQIT